ncbi:MAG: MFS transporter [Chloroflexi bacterium]|nr:MFS transporter [Chloroflexota bacterium]
MTGASRSQGVRPGWASRLLSGGAIEAVMTDPVFRSIFIILIIQGVALGSQMPFMPLWATERLGVGPVEVGTISLVTSLATAAFGLSYGVVTDRTRRRVPWLVVAFGLAIPLRIAIAWTENFIIGTLLYAAISVAMFTLFFAILGDWFRHRKDERGAEITNIVRLGFTIGWLIGSFAAGRVVAMVGFDGLFLTTAVLQFLSFAVLALGVRDAPFTNIAPVVEVDGVVAKSVWHDLIRAPMAWYLLTTICTGAASVARMTMLPLYLRDVVKVDTESVGIVFGIEPVYEIPISLLAASVVRRYGVVPFLFIGNAAGIFYFGAIAFTSTFAPFLAIEVLYAIVVTATFGFGIVHAQNLLPKRGGTAIAVYNAASMVGPVVAAPALGYVAENIGWSPVFVIASVLMAVACGTFFMSDRAGRRAGLLR